jgi:hypothetical protein
MKNIYYTKMKRSRNENQFEESLQHMEMACLMNDTRYLYKEVVKFLKSNNLNTMCEEDMTQVKNVSLEAAMEGRVGCLECLYEMDIPLDEMCPLIGACHGHKNVVEFCANKGMDCTEAWERYFDWVILNPNVNPKNNTDITLASEWIQSYNNQKVMVNV